MAVHTLHSWDSEVKIWSVENAWVGAARGCGNFQSVSERDTLHLVAFKIVCSTENGRVGEASLQVSRKHDSLHLQ